MCVAVTKVETANVCKKRMLETARSGLSIRCFLSVLCVCTFGVWSLWRRTHFVVVDIVHYCSFSVCVYDGYDCSSARHVRLPDSIRFFIFNRFFTEAIFFYFTFFTCIRWSARGRVYYSFSVTSVVWNAKRRKETSIYTHTFGPSWNVVSLYFVTESRALCRLAVILAVSICVFMRIYVRVLFIELQKDSSFIILLLLYVLDLRWWR